MQERNLIDKIRNLPPEKQAEVFDFIEFLAHREDERCLVHAATKMSEDSFSRVWDNPEDAAYDNL